MKVQILTVIEIDVDPKTKPSQLADHAQTKLDAFREAIGPSENYGLCIFRATGDDLDRFRHDECMAVGPHGFILPRLTPD